ncbi:thermonuclease family protein [Rhizobium sp. ARZ01]|uniref:thermonuclease family protein n=1 Tax=Rhizobium sp. ARZ01 TaxID=2769313 RepID=UPI00177BEEFF|nr:thermonuclease family protein [Rhizobium sp. ARZ01]MBD9374503.1 thermonuclease family protein [Rhizobium sp. ARZ01]
MESFRHLVAPIVLATCLIGGTEIALAAEGVAGPVIADVIRVVDGDTILVSARPWPQQTVEVLVRLRGIDAPELKAKCSEIRRAARTAKDRLDQLVGEGRSVLLTNVSGDKYFGRVVADVRLADGTNPAQDLVAAGLATAYHGGRKLPPHCQRPV